MEQTAMEAKRVASSANDMVKALDAQLAVQKELYDRAVKRGGAVDEILEKERQLAELKLTELQIQLLELENQRALASADSKRVTFLEMLLGKKAEVTKEELEGIAALDAAISETELKLLKLDEFIKGGGSLGKGGKVDKDGKDLPFVKAVGFGVIKGQELLDEYKTDIQLWAEEQLGIAADADEQALKRLNYRLQKEKGLIENHLDWLEKKREEDAENNKKTEKQKEDDRIASLNVLQQSLDAVGMSLQGFSMLAEKDSKKQKKLAAAGATIDTLAAIVGVLKNAGKGPQGGIPGFAIAQAIATGIFGFAQVKKILATDPTGGSDTKMASPAPSPTFNVVGTSGGSQLREAVERGMEKPVKAYVTQKDINSSAELDRNTRRSASIIG